MKKADEIVMGLVRRSLGDDVRDDFGLFRDVDWNEVMDVAFDQGVAGIVFDAVERLPEGRQPELRYSCDFDCVLIRRELVKQGLYDSCVKDAERFGLQKFLVALDGVADLVEGKKELADLSECERLMWEDIIRVRVIEEHSEGWFRTRLRVLRQMKRNDWKYRLYTDSSAWKNIYGSLRRYVIRVMKQPEVVRYMFGKGTPERNPIK